MTSSWQTKAIGEVLRVVNGGTPKTGDPRYWDGDHQWITPAEMGRLETPYLSSSRRALTNAGLRVAAELVPENSIILSSRAPIGHLVINAVPMAFNQGCKGLVPTAVIDTKFAYYFLLSNIDLLESLGTGATFKELSSGKLKEVPITFPSFDEQQRIVGILDEAFAGIATAKANAEKNLKHARAIFDSHLQSIFESGRWQCKGLSVLCETFADGDWIESKDQSANGVRLVQTGNVGRGVFKDRGHKARYVSDATFKRLKCTEIFAGDCLVSRLPDPVGRSCLIPETGKRMITAVDCTIVRFNPELVEPEFFIYYSQSQDYLKAVDSATTGTTRNRISRSNLGQVQIPVPSRPDQNRIVCELDALANETQRLESLYQRKLAALDALKQSLLHQAFSGQL